jgi:putative Mn2+ efflux pump MntP
MKEQLIAAFFISVLHGFIPGHWLPFLALAKKMGWTKAQTLRYTGLAAIAHAGGTVIIGLIVAQLTMWGIDSTSSQHLSWYSQGHFEWFGSALMVLLGVWFLYRHHRHHHFHFPNATNQEGKWAFGVVLFSLFLSPCMEIESYFFTLAPLGWGVILTLVLVYSLTTWLSMMGGVWIGFQGLERWNSHKLEHNAGIITGIVMIISGLMLAFA